MTERLTLSLASDVIAKATARNLMIATAESCTGGLISAALTDVPGASHVFTHGFVTYANIAKERQLGVDPAVIAAHGAVSAQVAAQMAKGACQAAAADAAVSVTGIAGPGGGTPDKPVGLVYIATATKAGTVTHRHLFPTPASRSTIRVWTARAALRHLLAVI